MQSKTREDFALVVTEDETFIMYHGIGSTKCIHVPIRQMHNGQVLWGNAVISSTQVW